MRDYTHLSQNQKDIILWERLNEYAKELIPKHDPLKRIEIIREEGLKRYTKTSLRLKAFDNDEYQPGIYLYTEQPDELGAVLTCAETKVSVSGLIAFLNANEKRREKIGNSIKNLFLN